MQKHAANNQSGVRVVDGWSDLVQMVQDQSRPGRGSLTDGRRRRSRRRAGGPRPWCAADRPDCCGGGGAPSCWTGSVATNHRNLKQQVIINHESSL